MLDVSNQRSWFDQTKKKAKEKQKCKSRVGGVSWWLDAALGFLVHQEQEE